VERRDPLLGLGGLTTLLGLLVFGWVARQPPSEQVDCMSAGPAPVRDAWMVGLAPAAFVAGCGCMAVALWASAGVRRGERPGTASFVLAAIVVALGLHWCVAGERAPAAAWASVALFALVPSCCVVPGLSVLVWRFARKHRDRWAWRLLRTLSWWSALILVPAFVAIISGWGGDFYC
jgi:hypothetical protein